MRHEFYSMTCQDVEVIDHPSMEPAVFATGDAVTVVGCKQCEMVLEEALTLPCPGRPVESMLDEVG